ncbi:MULTISPECIES: hypothetical protein [Chitinibacteraceae]|uniref:Transposase n=2 Tax=Chitinibacteraceae TaxID=2897177 RepID=A0A7H9BJM8_9NEIS|nr:MULTISPECIES: hypothetical protein [Chitinibacteraceae]MBM5572095.1 hypothetical protein [Deefgea chitinilytica]MBM9889330.1 hypothetical protein [Deefgea sp. CFH1-16]QLG88773.1 hypothetical protein HQ393_11315 [Chitinibacter bivalviorum]
MKNFYQNHFKIETLQYLRRVGSLTKAARRFDVHPSTLATWQRIGLEEFMKRELQNTKTLEPRKSTHELEQRIQRLEQENAVLRQAARLFFMC